MRVVLLCLVTLLVLLPFLVGPWLLRRQPTLVPVPPHPSGLSQRDYWWVEQAVLRGERLAHPEQRAVAVTIAEKRLARYRRLRRLGAGYLLLIIVGLAVTWRELSLLALLQPWVVGLAILVLTQAHAQRQEQKNLRRALAANSAGTGDP